MTAMIGEEQGKEERPASVIHMDWKQGKRGMFSVTGKRQGQAKAIAVYCIDFWLSFSESQMLPWFPEQTLLSCDIDPKGQNGLWRPSFFSALQPLLYLHLNQVLGPNSLLLACPLLVSSQPIQSTKKQKQKNIFPKLPGVPHY